MAPTIQLPQARIDRVEDVEAVREHRLLPGHASIELQDPGIGGAGVRLEHDGLGRPSSPTRATRRIRTSRTMSAAAMNAASSGRHPDRCPSAVEILDERRQLERVAGFADAVIEHVDAPDHRVVDGLRDCRDIIWPAWREDRLDGGDAVDLPDETCCTERDAVIAPDWSAALMMVEPARLGIMDAADVEHDVGGRDLGPVACADQSMIVSGRLKAERRASGSRRRGHRRNELAAVGQQDGVLVATDSPSSAGLRFGKETDL